MNLAEIRNAVGPYLTRNELAACIRGCRDWHDSFIPFLYCYFEFLGTFPENFDRGDSESEKEGNGLISVSSGQSCDLKSPSKPVLPSLATIQRYARHIRVLSLNSYDKPKDIMPFWQLAANVRDLKKLHIHLSCSGDHGSFRLLLNQFLINNPELQRLTLYGLHYPGCLKQLYKHAKRPSSSLDLTDLCLYSMSITEESMVALLDTSPRLAALSLVDCLIWSATKKLGDEENVSGTKNNNHINTNTNTYAYNIINNNSHVKALSLRGSLGSSGGLSTFVDWVRHTGFSLESLSFGLTHPVHDHWETDEDERLFLKVRTSRVLGPLNRLPSCPRLSELELEGVHMVDGGLAKILTAFPGLTRLVIPGLYVGPTDFEVLAGTLIGSLTVLDFGRGRDSGGWDHIKPWMWRSILCFGSQLVELGMDNLDTEALGEQMMKDPWACHSSLKILRIRCVSLSRDHTSNLWAMRELMALKGLEDIFVHNISNPMKVPNYNNYHSKIAAESKANPERTLKNIAFMNKNGTSNTTETILVKFCQGGSLERAKIIENQKSQWILETWPKIKSYRSSGDQHWYS
ncbi:hypothetical protein BGZ83_006189 [Gryganskiella cystojenkinii]|nr:hypothetical protein BGZ83_006189 [Gryganskiella cystojenkinii]